MWQHNMIKERIVLEPWKSHFENIHDYDDRVIIGTDYSFAMIIASPSDNAETW